MFWINTRTNITFVQVSDATLYTAGTGLTLTGTQFSLTTPVATANGGTGLGSRDRTVEAVRPLLEKELPGFGEIFRVVSFHEQVGTAAILSRAVAGGVRGRLVVSMPGSKAAVELALTRVLLPELRHAIRELRR